MFIKHVILDGFKSYRDRTNIGTFDPHFNAITGYNGSGKSNILDAICFVLGLNSLQTVRATCLGDLIYKGAGLLRASVSIVFDNLDKRAGKCPIGYEKYDEIIVSRTVENAELCKYFLNGLLSTKKDIAEMLGSIQLNINQPNFVIMQGKITKVVNMKPKELLFMIEETVGATAYQAKRDKTQKELDDKERQVQNIIETMNDIIFPALNKQKKAAADIEEFNLLSNEYDQKKKDYCVALYKEKKVELVSRNKALEKILKADSKDEENLKNYQEEIKACQSRQNEMKNDGTNFDVKISEAEKEMSVFKKKMLVVQAQEDSARQNEQEAKEKVKEFVDALQEEKNQMNQFQNKGKALIDEFNKAKTDVDTAEKNYQDAKKLETELKMGAIVDEYGNAMNALKQLQDVEEKIVGLQTNVDMNDMEEKRLTDRLKAVEAQMKKAAPHTQIENRYNAACQSVKELKAEAAKWNFDMENPKNWQNIYRESNEKINRMEQRKQNLFRQYPNLKFYYKPSSTVDPEKVKGFVYNLIKFKELDTWGTALEVAAKGFLLNLVVDEVAIARYFVEPGVIPNRTTIHPMDVYKNDRSKLPDQRILDSKLGKGVAVRVVDLMEYDRKYKDLIEGHIGHIILVETSQIAKNAAFNHHFYSIAKNGDSVDPDGIMQGGARKNGGEWIKAAEEVRSLNEEIAIARREQSTFKIEQEFSFTYQKAIYELETATNLRDQTPKFLAMNEIAEIKKKTEEISEKNNALKQEKKGLEKVAAKLKSQVDNLDKIRANQYEQNKADIKKWEKKLEEAQKKYNSKQSVYANVDVDIRARETLINDCQKDVEKAEAEFQECVEAIKLIKIECDAAKEAFATKQEVYNLAVGESKEWQSEKNKLEAAINKFKEKLHEAEMSKMHRDNDRKDLTNAVKAIQKRLEDVEESNPETNFENLPPGRSEPSAKLREAVDFLDTRMVTMRERLDYEGAEKMDVTKKKINDAEKKLKQVSTNRDKLQDAVRQLDKHKMNLVSAAYDRINKEFDSMMSTLLPESHARLVPVNSKDLTDGLNIHVCLGGVWKESLTELSGGQRSLVALALVLSLCMYSPAPFYVLDEIDAALDMNHTQNIGCLIRERFKETQFICVSLKDGMYTNANVLFQTNFVSGRSEVRRCVKKGVAYILAPQGDQAEKNQRPGPSRKGK